MEIYTQEKTAIEFTTFTGLKCIATIIGRTDTRLTIENHDLGIINSWLISDLKLMNSIKLV
jgi:hypothetical protein